MSNRNGVAFPEGPYPVLECGALHFIAEDLYQAWHTCELVPRKRDGHHARLTATRAGTGSCAGSPDFLDHTQGVTARVINALRT